MGKKKYIAILLVIVIVIAAIAIIDSSIPKKSQVKVSVSKVIEDHADEVSAGKVAETAYIFDVSITNKGSAKLSLNPCDFCIVTSNGTLAADTSGFFSNVTSQLHSSSLSSGQSATGQIYDAFADNVKISSIYYSYDGQHYTAASIPNVSQWISYIGDINVQTNDTNITATCTPSIVGSGYNSGTVLSVNISITNYEFASNASITALTVPNQYLTNYIHTKLPTSIGYDQKAYIILNITMPDSSHYYKNIDIDITASNQ
ncbi:MAG: hypothetical protein AMDU4_FER2C00035G0025 [Ferroplasma sp. Type II]|jgi:hypothetical protein|uniref:DUF4352 domain-containing protein n=1 Tax=Ferroplasma sp. Type II TaxID=261388 RepID=UPI0003895058|nr:DUF4352 domain-containing protein [Ferroplasma sp. Type II]EQB73974.1 MAG: hypothetical protein AMDU4_FER2C00035G0025 [Ferroplasma sp. Type II]